jgi:hypothetical protein
MCFTCAIAESVVSHRYTIHNRDAVAVGPLQHAAAIDDDLPLSLVSIPEKFALTYI